MGSPHNKYILSFQSWDHLTDNPVINPCWTLNPRLQLLLVRTNPGNQNVWKITANVPDSAANRIEHLSRVRWVASFAGWQPNSLIESTAGSDMRHWQIAPSSHAHTTMLQFEPLFNPPPTDCPTITRCSTLLERCVRLHSHQNTILYQHTEFCAVY